MVEYYLQSVNTLDIVVVVSELEEIVAIDAAGSNVLGLNRPFPMPTSAYMNNVFYLSVPLHL
jgi:hypothetical protein